MDDAVPPSATPPPIFTPPPPVIVPPIRPQPPKRGRGWMVLAIILLVLLGLSMLVNVSQFAGSIMHGGSAGPVTGSRDAGPRLDEAVIENNHGSSKIAVVDVNGIITSSAINQSGVSMVDVIKTELDKARDDSNVKAVILRVDSPGGEVLASDEISEALKNFQGGKKSNGQDEKKSKAKPVIVSMGNLAASGGYYISAPCRWIVANKMTLTGSVGVIMHGWNYRGLIDKIGIAPETYKSGKYKDMLSGSRATNEIPAGERAMVQGLIDEVYGDFKQVVAEGRGAAHEKNKEDGHALATDWAEYADGRVLSGSEALKLGFVDELGNFDLAVKRAKTIAGIEDADLIRYEQRYDLSDFLHIFGETKSQAASIKVDLGLDAPKLQAGELYFLSPVLFH